MRVLPGFGSAGSSRSLRRTASAVGVGQTAAERERRATFPEPGRLGEPTKEEILAGAEAGCCAWCTDGRTFRNIALHWERGHGFDVHELRERLVLPKQYRFASQEYRQLKSRQAIAAGSADRLKMAPKAKTHVLGAYGRKSNAEKAKLVTREQRLDALSHVDRDNVIAATKRRWAKMNPEERAEQSKRMADMGRLGAVALNEYLKEHPEARELALARRKERHGY